MQEDYNILKARCETSERQNQQLQQENARLTNALEANSAYTSQQTRGETNSFSIDDIEALKQQVGFHSLFLTLKFWKSYYKIERKQQNCSMLLNAILKKK